MFCSSYRRLPQVTASLADVVDAESNCFDICFHIWCADCASKASQMCKKEELALTISLHQHNSLSRCSENLNFASFRRRMQRNRLTRTWSPFGDPFPASVVANMWPSTQFATAQFRYSHYRLHVNFSWTTDSSFGIQGSYRLLVVPQLSSEWDFCPSSDVVFEVCLMCKEVVVHSNQVIDMHGVWRRVSGYGGWGGIRWWVSSIGLSLLFHLATLRSS